jgi:hypothetical protein
MWKELYDNLLEIVLDVVWTCIIILTYLIVIVGLGNLIMRFLG